MGKPCSYLGSSTQITLYVFSIRKIKVWQGFTLYPVLSELDQTKECFAWPNINLPASLDILDADPVPLLQVEQPPSVAHHLHGHPPVLLALQGIVLIHQDREALVLVLVQVGPLTYISWYIRCVTIFS